MPLDDIDHHMLEVLQRQGRITNRSLADELGLSPSPCHRRHRALEASGIIAGYTAQIDRLKIGLGTSVFIELKINQHSNMVAAELTEALASMPEVIAAYVVSGRADVLLEVAVADLDHYERFLFDVLIPLPMIEDIQSDFVLGTLKRPSAVPTRPPSRAVRRDGSA